MADVLAADVAVIGAGPAGMAAACAAAEAGRRVVMLDEGAAPGGRIWRHGRGRPPATARRWRARLAGAGATVLPGTAVVDARPGELAAEGPSGAIRVQAEALVVATGARELFLPFAGWTLPGVVGVGGLQALLKGGLDLRDERVVVAGTGPLPLAVAAAVAGAGGRVAALLEQAPARRLLGFAVGLWRTPGRLLQAARYQAALGRVHPRPGCWVVAAEGRGRVEAALVTDGRSSWRVPCRWLAAAWGLVPATEVARLLGCALAGDAVAVDDRMRTSVPGVYAAGEPNGVAGVETALVEGELAGRAAAGTPLPAALLRRRARLRREAARMASAFRLRPDLTDSVADGLTLCRCEDVAVGEARMAGSWREARLHTRLGMGPCQGRVCGPAATHLLGWAPPAPRPPLLPAHVGTLTDTWNESMGES